jgi:hypothetical protein
MGGQYKSVSFLRRQVNGRKERIVNAKCNSSGKKILGVGGEAGDCVGIVGMIDFVVGGEGARRGEEEGVKVGERVSYSNCSDDDESMRCCCCCFSNCLGCCWGIVVVAVSWVEFIIDIFVNNSRNIITNDVVFCRRIGSRHREKLILDSIFQ